MMNKSYAVNETLQKAEIDKYCFKECGKIKIGAIIWKDMVWVPCGTEKCAYIDRQADIGEFIGRKLISA